MEKNNEGISNKTHKQIRDVKPTIDTYCNVEIYRANREKEGHNLKISEATVELIEMGLKSVGIK